MLEFKTEKISKRVTRIYGFTSEMMYLVEGDEKAALIDTGSGIGSLKQCVDQLTDKPIIVLLTHGHVDHALGAVEFETVHMNHLDDYIYLDHSASSFRDKYLKLSPNPDELRKEQLEYVSPCDSFLDLKGGDSFDLGGVTIEIYNCSGHTRGSVVMLIKEDRMLLLGDACNYFTFMFDYYSTSISDYRNVLIKLNKEVDGKYDRVLLSHGENDGYVGIIDDIIKVCEDIMEGNVDGVPFEFMGCQALIAKKILPNRYRVDGMKGNVVYSKDRIF